MKITSARSAFVIKVFIGLLVAAAVFIWLRWLLAIVTGVLMYLVNVLFIPIAVIVLGWFVFSVWGRVYFRAWHIRRIRNGRYMREAIERGRKEC